MHERDGIRLMEYLDGTLSSAERQEVEAWLSVDPEARRLLAEHRAVWAVIGEADVAPAAEASEAFRRRTVERAQEPALSAWKPRVAALIAASLLVGVIIFAWHDASSRSTLDSGDMAVVGNLDLLENLDFVEQHHEVLDTSVSAAALREFPALPAPVAPAAPAADGAPR